MYEINWFESGLDPSTEPPRPLYTVELLGPRGSVRASGFVWVTDDPENVEINYWSIVHTLDGIYHCCLTGNVFWI